MTAGAPSKYDPAYCERVIELGRQGKSKVYMAGTLGVCSVTIDNWLKEHQEFFYAFSRAMTLSQIWWEDKGQGGIEKAPSEFQGSLWSRSMAARFPDDWREKQDVNHSGGVTVQIVRFGEDA